MRRVGTDALPESESATSVFVWRGRSSRSCVVASFPLGAGGARPRVEGAPRPPGSVRSSSTPGASAKKDPCSGGPACPGPVFARLDRMYRRYAWLRRAVGSRSRIWNPGASGGGSGPCARPPRSPSGSCASSGLIGVVRDVAAFRVVALADLITHHFDGHPFAGRHGIGEVAEFEARYYEQAAVAWIAGRFILAESPR